MVAPVSDVIVANTIVNGYATGTIAKGIPALNDYELLSLKESQFLSASHDLRQKVLGTSRCHIARTQEDLLLQDDVGINPPWFMFHFGKFLCGCFQWLLDTFTPAAFRVNDVIMGGYIASHVLLTLTELGVPDALGNGPLTIEELSKAVGANKDGLYRCMRYAVGINFFQAISAGKNGPTRFANNRLSATLREHHVQSQKYLVLSQVGHGYRAFQELTAGLTSGSNIYKLHSGSKSYWETLQKDPFQEDRFSRAMLAIDKICLGVLGEDLPWEQFSRVIDIGGAYGSMLATVMEKNPSIQGVLFDQPNVVERAKTIWQDPSKRSLLSRTTFVAGDFFKPETLPKARGKGDLYLLRLILHDWSDEEAIKILASVHQAIADTGATLLILDGMPNDNWKDATNRVVLQTDLIMMVLFGSKERSRSQLESLLSQSSFKLKSVIPTRSCLTGVVASAV
eukprot:jgi/Botrbrau1/5930/Bobra.0366s0104.1